jgi:hypothetical protein
MLGLTACDLYEVMRAYGVESSQATLWRAEQFSSSHSELQGEIRRVYQALGLVFYENHGIAFDEKNMPDEAEIERRKLPRCVIRAFHRLRNGGSEPKKRTKLVRRLDGEEIVRLGARKAGRLNLPDNQNTTKRKANK